MSKNVEEKKKGRITDYFKNVKAEMKKVVWPNKKELLSYTGIVVITCLFFSVSIWAVDTVFQGALRFIFNISL